MTLTLNGSVLSTGDARRTDGSPFGVANVMVGENPGAEVREFVGADRVAGEWVRCNHGVVSFQTTRIFASVGDAVAWAMSKHWGEPTAGKLVYGGNTVFENAVVTSKRLSLVGVAVITQYTIEG